MHIATEPKTLVVLGTTGSGKSTLLNAISKTNDFLESEGATSCTKVTSFKTYSWRGNGELVTLCDTQGLSDTGGDRNDDDNIRQLVSQVRRLKKVDLFMITINAGNCRLTDYTQNVISFMEIFGTTMLDNTVLVFTNWQSMVYPPNKEVTRTQEFQQLIKSKFGTT
jgi:predicted GTPase